MGAGTTPTTLGFTRDLQFAEQTIQNAVAARTAAAASSSWTKWSSSWTKWSEFCAECDVEPTLPTHADPIPFFLVFAIQYRDGTLAKNHNSVRSATVADVLRHIGQKMALLGRPDPCILPSGRQEFRLARLLKGFTKDNPPPERLLQQLCVETSQSALFPDKPPLYSRTLPRSVYHSRPRSSKFLYLTRSVSQPLGHSHLHFCCAPAHPWPLAYGGSYYESYRDKMRKLHY